MAVVWVPIEGFNKRSHMTGIADLVRVAFKRNLNRFIFGQSSYDSEVFRYSQSSQHDNAGLYSGESCRLSAVICSHDEQCCSSRCLCRRWSTIGEQRCVRKYVAYLIGSKSLMAFGNAKVCPIADSDSSIRLIYWLDREVNENGDNRQTQQRIRSIHNNLKTFHDPHECRTSVESLTEQDRLILIVSGSLGRDILQTVHDLPQLSSVYVYCMDKKLNEEWARQYRKVKDVIVCEQNLIDRIKFDKKTLVNIDQGISFNIYTITDDPNPSIIRENESFVRSLILLNSIIRLRFDPKDREELISCLKKQFHGNKRQLRIIEEFKQEYSNETALLWYIHESFLYTTLNKALNEQSIEQMLLFRLYLQDMYEQLKQNQYGSQIRVYHSQMMSFEERHDLEKSKNGYISIKTFLFANTNQNKVLESLINTQTTSDKCKILFVIDANPSVATANPFIDISRFHSFMSETIIMFMLGSIFRLKDVNRDGNIWTVQMELCGENEHNLEQVFEYMNRIHGNENRDSTIDRRAFGDIAHRIGESDVARKMYDRQLDEAPKNDPVRSDLHCSLGRVYREKKDYSRSMKCYNEALKECLRRSSSNFIELGNLYGSIAEIYLLTHNDRKSLDYYEKAVAQYQKAHAEDHEKMADFYNNMGSIHRRDKKYADALEFYKRTLVIDGKHLSSNHPNIAKTHNNIAIIYYYLSRYDLALNHYRLSLAIKVQTLDPQHYSIANVYSNIGSVYEIQSDFRRAAIHYRKAADIYHVILPDGHEDLIKIDDQLKNVLNQLH
ncbi:unnamed protein product [Rotaria socialis]|nr:unnamed protein product [Rotaria socialis]